MKAVLVLCMAVSACSSSGLFGPGDGGSPSGDSAAIIDASTLDLGAGGDGVNEVPCPSAPCSTVGGNVCCVSNTVHTTCQLGPCAPDNESFACDGPEDCAGGVCCFNQMHNLSTSCTKDCASGSQICKSDADCNPGQHCLQLEFGPPSLSSCASF